MSETTETKTVPLGQRRKKLRTFRKQYGITLAKFGKRAGVSQPMLSQFERGDSNLSDEAWAGVLKAMTDLISEDGSKRFAEITKAKGTAAKLGAEVGTLEGDVYLGIERQYDANAREKLKRECGTIDRLRSGAANNSRIKAWLDAEMEAARAVEKAMNCAELAHADFNKTAVLVDIEKPDGKTVLGEIEDKSPSETMTLLAATKTAEGKIVPWRRKKLPTPAGARFQVCIANNPKEEAELLEAGWQVVKSE